MNSDLLASIVITNYNYARFLREAINSALNQTYRNTEVIIVDDGSIDESHEVIKDYGNRIRPVFKQNGGMGSTYNAGVSVVRGQVVLFLDSDGARLSVAGAT